MLKWTALTDRQKDAARGLYASAMAGFVMWLAERYEAVRKEMPKRLVELREHAMAGDQHRRTPDIVASIYFGLEIFAEFAKEIGVFSDVEAEKFLTRCWCGLGEAAAAQPLIQAESDPVERFTTLLRSAIASGRVHVAKPDGGSPLNAARWGWQRRAGGIECRGDRVGWVNGQDLYLDPEAAYIAAQRLAQDGTEPLSISSETLRKRLHEKGKLVTTDSKRKRLTVRKKLDGGSRTVIHVSTDLLG